MATKKKRLLRGLDNYKTLITENGYFVDKTLLIQEVLDDEHEVILLPRPRRFGKSLNLSMLANYFDITQPNNAALFKPYKIWKTGKTYTSQQAKYPVIHLTLKDIKEDNYKDCLAFFKEIISELFQKHDYLLESTYLTEWDKKTIQQLIEGEASTIIIKRSLKKLSGYLQKHYQRKVIILIDEYDTPIHAGYRNNYYKKVAGLMKSFLGGAFKTNTALYKGVITGILRVSKESIFSDLNNISTYTLLDKKYANKFGFSIEETKDILQHFQLIQHFNLVKSWYNGYTIGQEIEVYNPWSITGYIAKEGEGFKAHWVNTSSDELIRERIIEKEATSIRNDIEQLLLGNIIVKRIDENIVFEDFDTDKELLWSLLLFAGYLTPTRRIAEGFYGLRIPNYEVKTLFQKIIQQWLQRQVSIRSSLLLQMIQSLTNNRIKDFEKYFQAIMGDTFSYFDVGKRPEDVWQAYVLGLLAIAGEDYIIRSNRESGNGRYDILMLPKVKTKYGIVIEIKSMDKKSTQQQIDKQLDKALEQIKKNEYYKELLAHNIPKRIEIAMVFTGKKVYMKPNN